MITSITFWLWPYDGNVGARLIFWNPDIGPIIEDKVIDVSDCAATVTIWRKGEPDFEEKRWNWVIMNFNLEILALGGVEDLNQGVVEGEDIMVKRSYESR